MASRAVQLKKKYGLTEDDYERMLLAQHGRCAICGGEILSKRRLAVDHCHKSGRVRGLLCGPCNGFLGRINDDPASLLAYLGKATLYGP